MTTRRDFLKNSGIITAGALLNINQFKTFIRKPSSVIVIGARFAGLAAANYLRKKKIKVTVLEARNRIGGRVHSFNIPNEDLVVELGAEWVGKSHERILTMCEEYQL